MAAACLDAFSSLLIIFLFMVVETAWEVVFLKVSAALFSASWLDGSDPSALTACAASTILAVASANSLAADRSRFCGGCVSSVLSQLESGNMKNRERKKIVYLVKCGVIIMKECKDPTGIVLGLWELTHIGRLVVIRLPTLQSRSDREDIVTVQKFLKYHPRSLP